MGRWRRTNPCERATQWISLRLDGELSELEQAALGRHLESCPRCLALSARVGGFTWMLREQPLVEIPSPVVVAAPRRQAARVARRGGAVLALAAAVGAVAGFAILPQGSGQETSALGFSSVAQQKRFAHFEHIRAEPEMFVTAATIPAVPSFAARALG
jgi:predicted anti-sigma-YlaC factor YlaD